MIGDGDSNDFRCNVVNFREGATTGWHTHTCDQILVVTSGRGVVATEQEEREIIVGDIVHIKGESGTGMAQKKIRRCRTSPSPLVGSRSDHGETQKSPSLSDAQSYPSCGPLLES